MTKIEWSREAIQAAWKAFNVASENPMKNALDSACEVQGIASLRAEIEKLRDMLLRSDKLTRQEWYDMRNTQLAEEANAAALKEAGDE